MAANVTLPDELLERVRARATDEGKTVDDLAVEAVSRLLAERSLARFRREAERRSRGMSADQVNETVNQAIRETRNESRGR